MKGLRTTIYKVPDLLTAKNWYAKAFQQEPYFDEPYYVGFNISGFELGLLPDEMSPANKTENVLSYWGVDDIEKVYQHLLSVGATEYEKPNNVGGELMVAALKDPWGNVIGIIYNPYFKIP
jgi:lactoylglutathione lyase